MKEKIWMKIAWKLPHNLVYFCTIRVIAHATAGKYSNTVVPELKVMDALDRWQLSK